MIIASDFQGTDRFSLEGVLGSGSSGTVYQAFDKERKQKVALKTLKNVDPVEIYRFKNEFRVLADVSHRNLVKLYDLLFDGKSWFFTMELVQSETFVEHVRLENPQERAMEDAPTLAAPWEARADADDKTHALAPALGETNEVGLVPPGQCLEHPVCDYNKLAKVFKQVTDGLIALHQAGKLHCDIKPSNVLVTDDHRAVILDLGVARDLSTQQLYASLKENVSGTPAYMSPEQARGSEIGPASDWYSMGVMLYEALTGSLPYRGSIMQVLYDKQRLDPRPPREMLPSIPEHLDSLCYRLLQRDPKQRLDGREILHALGVAAPEGRENLMVNRTTHNAPYLYREEPMNALDEAFASTQADQTVAVFVHGASGMGKTSIIKKFLQRLLDKHEHLVLLTGRCYQRESVPFKALDSLVDTLSGYLKRLHPREARGLMPPDVLALTRLFPVLGRVHAIANADRSVLRIPDSREQRRRAFEAWRALFRNLSNRGPIVLFIDDLQWGDRDSALLLNELLRPPNPPPLLLIGSYPSETAATSPLLANLITSEAAGDDTIIQDLVIGELEMREAGRLARWLLDEETPHSEELARTIARESGGCPFLIEAMVRYARTIALSGDAEVARAMGEASVEEVINYQLERLPKEGRRLMELIALAGQPIEPEALRQAAEVGDIGETLIALHAHKLIRIRGGEAGDLVVCYHNRVREAILASMSPSSLRSSHLLLAQALQTSAAAKPETLASHFRDAGDAKRAAEFAIKAADMAVEALAFDRAAKLYRFGLELTDDEEHPVEDLRIKLAESLANSGRGFEAGEAFKDAANYAPSGEALELRRCTAEQFLVSGHIDQGMETVRQVLESIGMRVASSPKKALLSLLWRRLRLKLRGTSFKEQEVNSIPPEQLIRIDTCWSMSVGLGLVNTMQGMDFSTRHLLLALDAGEPYRVARALAIEAAFSATSGTKSAERTESLLLTARELVERVENPHAVGLVRMTSGVASYLEGKWRQGAERCAQAEEILRDRCTGVTWEVDTTVQFLMRAYIYLGQWGEIAERYPALLKDNRERGDLYAEINMMTCISWLAHLINDRPEWATRDLDAAIARWSQQGYHLQHFWHLTGSASIGMYQGRALETWEALQKPWARLKSSMLLRFQFTGVDAYSVHARTALAALAETEPDSAQAKNLEKIIREDLKFIEKDNLAWANPLAYLLRAGLVATLGFRERALVFLSKAIAGFENCDMLLYRAAASRRRGQLMAEKGRLQVREADAVMRGQRIQQPERVADLLAPGHWPEAFKSIVPTREGEKRPPVRRA